MREERKIVTALFADVVGSTALGERLDPEEASLVIGEAVARIVAEVERFGGTISDVAGDGVLALFGAPSAHEDDPERAVRAGLKVVAETVRYAQDVAAAWSIEGFAVRVGINTGTVAVGPLTVGQHVKVNPIGDAVNMAARLQAAARPGRVLVGATTQRLVARMFEWGEPLQLPVKGKAEPVVAYEARRRREVRGKLRGLEGIRVPLIGRDAELALGRSAVDDVLAGSGSVLFVTGEAGIGKSRLIGELHDRFLEARSPGGAPRGLEGHCVSYGEALAYWPIQELLRDWLGFSVEQPELRLRIALRRQVSVLFGEAARDVYPFLGLLLGLALEPDADNAVVALSLETRQHRTFDALRQLLVRLADDGPVVVAIDDLQWADASSLSLLERLVELVDQAAVLFVMALRPERDHPAWHFKEATAHALAHRTLEIGLDALSDVGGQRLLASLIGDGVLPVQVEAELLRVAEGNPFYIEELVRSLINNGTLRQDADGWHCDAGVSLDLPETVGEVLQARIDRLDQDCRTVLAGAAVLGREFSLPLLRATLAEQADIGHAIGELQRLDLIRQTGRWPEAQFRFRHALAQEAAYQMVPIRQRPTLHARAASALRQLYAGRITELAGALARHHAAAGELTEALAEHRRAGDTARRAAAAPEAIGHYRAALDLASRLGLDASDPSILQLRLERGRLLTQTGNAAEARDDFEAVLATAQATGDQTLQMQALDELGFAIAGAADYSEAITYLNQARMLADALGDIRAQVSVLSRTALIHANQLSLELALADGEHALKLAKQVGDDRVEARALDSLKQIALQLGDLARLRVLTDRLSDIYDRRGELWYQQFVLFERSFVAIAAGQWSEAERGIRQAMVVARQIGDRGNEPLYLATLGLLHRSRGAYPEALQLGEQAVGLAAAIGHAEWIAWSELELGRTLLELLAAGEAISHLDRAANAAERAGSLNLLLRSVGHLAWAYCIDGQPAQADTLLTRLEPLLEQVATPPGGAFLFGGAAYLDAAQALETRGDTERAVALLGPLLRQADRTGGMSWWPERRSSSVAASRPPAKTTRRWS
jgi:predicted ATPase/class 3 adenylate cyclase